MTEKQPPAGEHPRLQNSIYEGPMPPGAYPRPCARGQAQAAVRPVRQPVPADDETKNVVLAVFPPQWRLRLLKHIENGAGSAHPRKPARPWGHCRNIDGPGTPPPD